MGKILLASSIIVGIFLILSNGMSSLENPITVFLLLLGFFGVSYGAVGLYRETKKKKK